MAGPGGDEVGRVSIRVVPDTSGFRRELQNAVREAEAGVEVTIPGEVDLDTVGFRAQLATLENARVTVPVATAAPRLAGLPSSSIRSCHRRSTVV